MPGFNEMSLLRAWRGNPLIRNQTHGDCFVTVFLEMTACQDFLYLRCG
jgi:hypothetical protein